MIDHGYPLLQIATDCLSYDAEDRPSAQELRHHLVTLKVSTLYGESIQQAEERSSLAQTAIAEREVKDRLIRELQEEKEHHMKTAVCSEMFIVVVGGTMSIFSTDNLTTVEVMDTETLQWCTAGYLPHPVPRCICYIRWRPSVLAWRLG